LIAGIKQALSAKSRVILFLNRKGFAPLLHCLDCGASPHCPRCSVPFTFYRRAGRLSCRYCGDSSSLPDTCPSCLASRLEPVGFGTERLEEEVRRLFPEARIGRLDRDLARTQAQADAVRGRLAAGELDILIGTQMLFRGFPLPPVGLVGLPYADAGLHVPDFRSAERTYQTLLDAVGLALPGDAGGKVVLQTYMPAHHAIASVVQQNETLFYEQELAFRKALGYPPFTHLISLHVSGKNAKLVQKAAGEWAGRLKAAAVGLSPEEVTIMGPIPAPVAQLRGRHRWQLLVKSAQAEAARQTVRQTLDELERNKKRRGLKFDVDVDPLEMM
jgi:primosomal protein N' (replication factor Y)